MSGVVYWDLPVYGGRYEVKDIKTIKFSLKRKKRLYYVLWRNGGRSWEPLSSFEGGKDAPAIREFHYSSSAAVKRAKKERRKYFDAHPEEEFGGDIVMVDDEQTVSNGVEDAQVSNTEQQSTGKSCEGEKKKEKKKKKKRSKKDRKTPKGETRAFIEGLLDESRSPTPIPLLSRSPSREPSPSPSASPSHSSTQSDSSYQPSDSSPPKKQAKLTKKKLAQKKKSSRRGYYSSDSSDYEY